MHVQTHTLRAWVLVEFICNEEGRRGVLFCFGLWFVCFFGGCAICDI